MNDSYCVAIKVCYDNNFDNTKLIAVEDLICTLQKPLCHRQTTHKRQQLVKPSSAHLDLEKHALQDVFGCLHLTTQRSDYYYYAICKLKHAASTHFLMHCIHGLHAIAFAKHQQSGIGTNKLYEEATTCWNYELH